MSLPSFWTFHYVQFLLIRTKPNEYVGIRKGYINLVLKMLSGLKAFEAKLGHAMYIAVRIREKIRLSLIELPTSHDFRKGEFRVESFASFFIVHLPVFVTFARSVAFPVFCVAFAVYSSILAVSSVYLPYLSYLRCLL